MTDMRIFASLMVLFLLVLAVSCHKVTEYPTSPRMSNPGRAMQSTVAIVWVADIDAMGKACAGVKGGIPYECAEVVVAPDGLTTVCTIYALRPADFNDQTRIALLGHGMFHCLGARHDQ